MAKLTREEQKILDSFERGEWKKVKNHDAEVTNLRKAAEVTFKKDQRLNIRISGKDLRALQRRALKEGIPYQTLASSVLHKFVEGHFAEGKA